MKANRFGRKREVVSIAGFSLVKLGSLQKREREYLLEVRRKLFERTSILLDLGREIARDLGIPEQEAWQLLQSRGAAAVNEEMQFKLLPYLLRIERRIDPDYQANQYPIEAVVLLLLSRLESLKEIAPDLEEAFGLILSKSAIAAFDKVPYSDRLEDPTRKAVSRQIVDAVTEDVYSELLEFISNEEAQWKAADPDDGGEEVNGNDPFSSES